MKIFTATVAVGLLLTNCQLLRADLITYEMGPFQVNGFGTSAPEAQSEAFGNLYDMLVEIENNLPPGHVMLDFVIEDQGWISVTQYRIDFHVIIWIPTDPGPPGGRL